MCVECGFVQAVCDARKRFIFVAMDMPGSTHDSRAFGFSALWAALDAGLVAEGFYLLGDAAYRGYMCLSLPTHLCIQHNLRTCACFVPLYSRAVCTVLSFILSTCIRTLTGFVKFSPPSLVI
jgi:hypothetical protein